MFSRIESRTPVGPMLGTLAVTGSSLAGVFPASGVILGIVVGWLLISTRGLDARPKVALRR